MNQRLIGLTGGIATGKTTVSNYLATKYDLPILDADVYAKEAVAKNSPIFNRICDRYGEQIKLVDGSLNRSLLGKIIFNDLSEKQWLESQIHPYVRDRFQQELQLASEPIVVLDIPLLFEANLTALVTEIWVVACDRLSQTARLQQRNNLDFAQAIARIDSQMALAQKIAAADVVLDNSGSLAELYSQVDRVLKIN